MKLSLLVTAVIAPFVSAHYFFDTLVIDGQESTPNKYVRSNTRPEKYNPTKWKNTRDDMTPDMPDFRCNKGSFTFAGQTGTAEVKAGTKLAMKLGVGATMKHPGPGLVYMSKAPGAANKYQATVTGSRSTRSLSVIRTRISKPMPGALGERTVSSSLFLWICRMASILFGPSTSVCVHGAHDGQAEFYYECAQVKVTGGGHGTPGPTIKFPGGYKKDDPSFNFSIWGGMKDYPMPGPAVWGGASGSKPASKVANVNGAGASHQEEPGTCGSHREHARDFSY
ncbi:endoglucanase [Aspergillus nomiae NRRL 13137]|uniref:AA9 family lytic polysaccharide monooxygenase n=1 Tax=Aspergillus nomiae NRRL (strain ATCC 15546 / NRRL 13137 / CBS 260.88 / M93) TaxID=1509407 RepID=A0A0L1JB97_ASPN3|nr:endoglucanase [Aspergillus nomiae NRRL 13137]KNG89024.1 endoglucanase [Aspergillus nomiae NRRL 13137]